MMRLICIVENVRLWKKRMPQIAFVSADEYLFDKEYQDARQMRIINLARNYGYLGKGYYVSLVAEGRGHKVIPDLATIQNLSRKEFYLLETDDLNAQVQKDLAHLTDVKYELSVYFGRNLSKRYEKLSRMLFNLFPCPAFRVYFTKGKHWHVASIKPMSPDKIQESHQYAFHEALAEYSLHRWGARKPSPTARYDLAILCNPDEKFAPSDADALEKFVKAGKSVGLNVQIIGKRDYGLLPQFDALFIRETTAIDHHTYRFAKKAEKEGLVVIDDPRSILYCTNKIFLYELFKRAGVSRPKTFILGEDKAEGLPEALGYPVIVKVPDGAFSMGVVKVEDNDQLAQVSKNFFKDSDYIVAQEFMPTPFDWRIGVLNNLPLYACKYFMSRDHWQIYKHGDKGTENGTHETFPVQAVDPEIISQALKATRPIGSGLYGVDIKVVNGKPYVIEVNDNPNIDEGVEDEILKDSLYLTIMQEFLRRIEKQHAARTSVLLPGSSGAPRLSRP